MDTFEAFSRRVERRLADLRRQGAEELDGIARAMAARGLAQSGARIKRQLEAIEEQFHQAADFALGEAETLPGRASIRREETAPSLRQGLSDHLNALYTRHLDMPNAPPAVPHAIEEHRARLHAELEGETEDYVAGVWLPYNAPTSGPFVGRPRARASESGGGGLNSEPLNSAPLNAPLTRNVEAAGPATRALGVHGVGASEAEAAGTARGVSRAYGVGAYGQGPYGGRIEGTSARGHAAGAKEQEADGLETRSVEPDQSELQPRAADLAARMIGAAKGQAPITLAGSTTPVGIAASIDVSSSLETVVIPAPPEIQEPDPSTPSPVWIDGRITLSPAPARNDLGEDLNNVFAALNADLHDFAGELAPLSNLDTRLVSLVSGLVDLAPASGPDQVMVHRLGYRLDELEECRGQVEEEWPGPLAGRYRALLTRLQRVLAHFDSWQQFIASPEVLSLSDEQVVQAVEVAHFFADALTSKPAREFVDQVIPQTMLQVAAERDLTAPPGEPTVPLTAGVKRWAFGLLQFVGNTLKVIGQAAKECGQSYVRQFKIGAVKQSGEIGGKHGKSAMDWIEAVVVNSAAGGVFCGAVALAHAFPTIFAWLPELVAFLTAAKSLSK